MQGKIRNEPQPNPTTGEWTVELIEGWIRLNPTTWKSVLAFEHNAALAYQHKGWERADKALTILHNENEKLQKQLAAERDVRIIADHTADELREQLAAEREKVAKAQTDAGEAMQQLDAERNRAEQWKQLHAEISEAWLAEKTRAEGLEALAKK